MCGLLGRCEYFIKFKVFFYIMDAELLMALQNLSMVLSWNADFTLETCKALEKKNNGAGWDSESLYFIPKDCEHIVKRGSHQALFDLNRPNWPRKVSYFAKANYRDIGDYYSFEVCNGTEINFIIEDIIAFYQKELSEFDFEVCPHYPVYGGKAEGTSLFLSMSEIFSPSGGLNSQFGVSFMLVPDLTLAGKCLVEDYVATDLNDVTNGAQLKENFEGIYERLMEMYNDPRYEIKPEGHIQRDLFDNPEEAIRRLFFVQKDLETNEGNLILGDLGNLSVGYSKSL